MVFLPYRIIPRAGAVELFVYSTTVDHEERIVLRVPVAFQRGCRIIRTRSGHAKTAGARLVSARS